MTHPSDPTVPWADQIARFARRVANEHLLPRSHRLEIVIEGGGLEPLLALEAALAAGALPCPPAELIWAMPDPGAGLRFTARAYDGGGRLLFRREQTITLSQEDPAPRLAAEAADV